MLDKYNNLLEDLDTIKYLGKVSKISEMIVESEGPDSTLGELCKIKTSAGKTCLAEVVAVEGKRVSLMTYGEITGIKIGDRVIASGSSLSINVSDSLLGRVINSLGEPIDNLGPVLHYNNFKKYSIFGNPPSVINRNKIEKQIITGIRAIDTFTPAGEGQRLGIFSGSGVGKSTLLGMIARNTRADVNVIALIGERSREVLEFMHGELKEEGLKRSVLVVSTSSETPLSRIRGAYMATTIAEFFRDCGKKVMLLFDSITRFAMAQREIGLSVGEVPSSRGYTPSVFALLPKVLERAGQSDKGSITAFYTVLVEGDDMDEPISDSVRGILDGHIILSRKIAEKNQYPAIDVLRSISRLTNKVLDTNKLQLANQAKRLLALYAEKEDLISVGAYSSGSSIEIDRAISKIDKLNKYLSQSVEQDIDYEKSWHILSRILL